MGYMNCVVAAPAVFGIDDTDLAVVLDDAPDADQLDNARRAARLCPAEAILIAGQSVSQEP
jgi:ferredoxin